MLLVFALIYNLSVTSLDISDAFLMVPQTDEMYVEISQGKSETHWRLLRCLPGQRNGALKWHQHFASICESAGLVPFPGSPTVMRHKQVCLCERPCGRHSPSCLPGDVEWFKSTIGATLKMKVDGPHLPASEEQLM